MPITVNPFSIEIPIKVGNLQISCFINENLFVQNTECHSVSHNHSDYEIRYISDGTCCQYIDGKIHHAKAGSLFIIPPLIYHAQVQIGSNCPMSMQYNLRFALTPPPVANANEPRKHSVYNYAQELLSSASILNDDAMSMLPFFKQLTNEIYQRGPGYVGNVKSLCLTILTHTFRLLGNVDRIFPEEGILYSGFGRTMIDEFFRYKYLNDVDVYDLANDMKVSPRHVNRILHSMFGLSFTEKLLEMRLEAAKIMLLFTDTGIHEVSEKCGFNTYNYFYISFKKATGMSPNEFRKKAISSGITEKST